MRTCKNKKLQNKLQIGVKIKIGKEYSELVGGSLKEGDVFEIVEGYFEYENGLYMSAETAPSIKQEGEDYESIYHLFGNDLEDFMDCEIMPTSSNQVNK